MDSNCFLIYIIFFPYFSSLEALTLDLFEGYQEKEKNPAAKKLEGCASADSILDGHDGDDLDASFQLDALLAKSCPHLSHRLVSSGTQTDDNTAPQKRRAPQIGTTRYRKSQQYFRTLLPWHICTLRCNRINHGDVGLNTRLFTLSLQ